MQSNVTFPPFYTLTIFLYYNCFVLWTRGLTKYTVELKECRKHLMSGSSHALLVLG
jgi:hypothetical protein